MSKFDIEKFPTSEAAKRMLRRVSPIYGNAYTAKWLYQVMGMEWDEARDIILSLREQAFTQTVTWGIEFQEHKYSIVPDDTLSLEERRARLYRRKTKKYPMNPWFLENYMKTAWNIYADTDETYDWGVVRLGILFDDDNNLRKMLKDVREIKPSHLVWKLFYDVFFDGDLADEEIAADDHPAIIIRTAPDGWRDWYPYGINNPNVPTHGGGGWHSPYICPNGVWRHDGTIWHGESWPGALYRGGIEDIAHDLLDLVAMYFASDSFITKDKRFSYGLGTSMEDQAKTTDDLSNIIRAAGFRDAIPYGINNPNVPTHGGGGRHSDYVKADGAWWHDGAVKHGESWPGALFRGGIEDMAHDFLNAVVVYRISDKAEATDDERNSPIVIRTTESGWQECYPYGINNPDVPTHGGGGQHSDYIRANGAWQHDGAVRHGESWPGALFRGGIEDMAHDRMAATTLYKIRDGCLVEDKHTHCWTGMDFTDSTEATDGNGELDATVCYRHNGLISRDGSHFRGETYSLGALDNGKGLKRVCRDGRWRHGDTSIVRGQLYSLA